jgi:hypothetical protein
MKKSKFKIIKELGEGASAKVVLVQRQHIQINANEEDGMIINSDEVALKII